MKFSVARILEFNPFRKKSFAQKDRGWNAAKYSRFQQNWSASRQEINREIKSDLPALRARAADLRKNNPVVSGMALDYRTIGIGPSGFDLQLNIKYPSGADDVFSNTLIKSKFDEWGHRDFCTVTKRFSWIMFQYLIAEHFSVDGEVVLRRHTGGSIVKNNPFGFTYEMIDANDIDHLYNAELGNDTYVIMGVELNKWRQFTGIYVKTKTPLNEAIGGYNAGLSRERIDISELIIAFDPLHYKQVHGLTILSSAMLTLKDVDMWEDYSLQNAKWSAARMAFLTRTKDAFGESRPEDESDDDGLGGKYNDLEAGSIEELPRGFDVKFNDPKFPHEQHVPFVKANGRKVAVGIGRDYASLYGDRDAETFSSSKAGELKERAFFGYFQSLMREMILDPIYEDFLKYSLLNDALAPLDFANMERYKAHYFEGYQKEWIDPYKQYQAYDLAEKRGFISKTTICARGGNRYEDVLKDKAQEQKLEKKYGIVYTNEGVQTTASEPVQQDPSRDLKLVKN